MNYSSERLLLRDWSPTDAPFILKLLNTEGWLTFIGDRGIQTLSDAEQYIATVLTAGFHAKGFGFWCLEEITSGKSVGMAGFVQRDWLPGTDLGFAVLPEYEGRGYAFEASTTLLKIAPTFGFHNLLAITTTDNERSIRLLHRLGFALTGTTQAPREDETLNLFALTVS